MRPSSRQIRPVHLCCAALLAAVIAFLCVHRAAADTSPGFVGSPSQTTLAPWASSSDVAIQASACGSSDSCIATGYFADSANHYSPLVVPIADGIAGSGSEVSLPAGASTIGKPTDLAGVSCWDASDCIAVGDYADSSSDAQALVVPIDSGVPSQGVAVSLPGNAAASAFAEPAPAPGLSSVSCAATGACVAAGSYKDTAGDREALVVPINGGSVGAGIEVAPPSGSASNGSQVSELTDVACWSGGGCVAVGTFSDNNGDTQALVVPITNGVPGAAVAVALPQDAATTGTSTVPKGELLSVSCSDNGSCVAVGDYNTSAGNGEGLVLPIDNGVPGTAVAAPLPDNALTANSTQAATLSDVSCTADEACDAVGDYVDSISPFDQEAVVVPVINGAAGTGQEVSLPTDAVGAQNAALLSVSCPAAGTCAAVGSYSGALGVNEMTVPISAGVAGVGSEPPAFTNESFTYPYTQLTSVSCTSSASCVVLGTYANTSGVQVPTVFSMQSPISIGTPALPSARKGASYATTLSAAGTWGEYSWSLVSGNLPAGLSLNSQTGEISGVPVATGTSTFTVQVSGTGAPQQSATQKLRITIAPARPPHVSAPDGPLLVTANHLQVQLGCTGSPCTGTVKLRATKVVPVKVKVAYDVKTRVEVKIKVKVKVKVKIKEKVKVKATTTTTATTTTKHRPKYRYEYRTKLVRKYRTKLVRKYRRKIVHRHHRVVIGWAEYSLAPGDTALVTVPLSRTGGSLLAKAKGHKLPVWLFTSAGGGNHVTWRATLETRLAPDHNG